MELVTSEALFPSVAQSWTCYVYFNVRIYKIEEKTFTENILGLYFDFYKSATNLLQSLEELQKSKKLIVF